MEKLYTLSSIATHTGISIEVLKKMVLMGLLEQRESKMNGQGLYLDSDAIEDRKLYKRSDLPRSLRNPQNTTACAECGEWFPPESINKRHHCAACAKRLAGPVRAGRLGDADA